MSHPVWAAGVVVIFGMAATVEYLLDEPGLRERAAIVGLARAQIPLDRAIGLAERHVNGHAVDARLEYDGQRVFAAVKVVAGEHKLLDVKVDAIDGTIVSSR
jgi:uncharacterized membrane protein YkoI